MGLDVCMSKIFLELTPINVRHLVAETGVLHKHDLQSFWRVDYPLSQSVSDDAKAILLKLGDREKVYNPALINPYFKHSEVSLHQGRRETCITVPMEGLSCVPDICQLQCTKHTLVCDATVQVQLVLF